jgi:hypothetical protein
MSGPNSDQPVELQPHEIQRLKAIFDAHRRDIDGTCACGITGCEKGSDARRQLWMGGINPVTGR